MLIRFSIRNFLSFRDKQEFTMLAGGTTSHKNQIYNDNKVKILKYSAIYGGNASGKSNVIKAIDAGKSILCDGLIKANLENKYFKLDNHSKEETYFDYEIKIGKKYYFYGFTVNLSESKITGEWLLELLKNGKEKVIFSRNIKMKELETQKSFKEKEGEIKLKSWLDDSLYSDDKLFLKDVIDKKRDDLEDLDVYRELYYWFEKNLVVIYPHTHHHDIDMVIENQYNIVELVKKLDTGILDIKGKVVSREYLPDLFKKGVGEGIIDEMISKMQNEDVEKAMFSDGMNMFSMKYIEENGTIEFKKVIFIHSKLDHAEPLELHEESDGTRRIIELLQVLIKAQKDGKTLLIDELDRSLHPTLTYNLINYYLNSDMNNENTQLIITTHEQSLLELDLVRRDAIWFTEKDLQGNSTMFSLDKFNVRHDIRLKKAYLEGRFGGTPLIKTMVNKSYYDAEIIAERNE